MGKLWDIRHIDKNPFSRIGRKLLSVDFLVWHYTANPGATAENHINYFQGLKHQDPHDDEDDRYASAHLFIDRDSAVEIIPLDEEAFHAGNRWYNQRSIGLELCIETDGSFHPNTIKRAIQIAAFLCNEHHINPLNKQIRHYDVTRKICPRAWVIDPYAFIQFKNDVATCMTGESVAAPPKPVTPLPIRITVNGKPEAWGIAIDGETWVPARQVGMALGATIGWNGDCVTVNGEPLPTRLIGGRGYVLVRDLAKAAGVSPPVWESKTQTVTLAT